ncbi:MAG: NAD-dependent epimerase/dehydratase family protein [Thermodesulfobacteria bacterium]|nr:NAD-dependent epimerase/dehydratase family protein [Thermodesulfobacteriota bacterium]
MASRTVAITGATGFIGRNLLKLLIPSYHIKALVRPQSFREDLPSQVEWVLGDLSDLRALRQLLEGAEVVIHLAGAIKGVEYTDFARVNVQGFRKILSVAEEVGIPRFLYVSSLAARQPTLSPYAATKREAEELLQASSLKSWHIFRPPAVYGPHDQELTPLIRLALKGVLPVFGSLQNRFSLLYVEDLCRAIARWLERENLPPKVYELHDGKPEGYSWTEVREIVARVRGKPPKVLKIPQTALKAVSFGALWGGKFLKITPMLTPHKVNELCHPDWTCDNAEVTKDLGWEPRWPFEKVLQDWVRDEARRNF